MSWSNSSPYQRLTLRRIGAWLRRVTERLIGLGTRPDQELDLQRQIRITNQGAVLVVLGELPYIAALYLIGVPQVSINSAIMCLLYPASLYLNWRGKHIAAGLWWLFSACLHIFTNQLFTGPDAGSEAYYLVVYFVAIMMFSYRQPRLTLFTVLQTTAFIIAAQYAMAAFPELNQTTPEQSERMRSVMFALASMMLLVLAYPAARSGWRHLDLMDSARAAAESAARTQARMVAEVERRVQIELKRRELAENMLHTEQTTSRLRRMETLQESMSPHFLFNSLSMINMLLHTGRASEAADAVVALGENYSLLLETASDLLAPFEVEWRFLDNYSRLFLMRFLSQAKIRLRKRGDFSGVEIPPLTLQPLVENCVKHGLLAQKQRARIGVYARRRDGFTELFVFDNGPGLRNGASPRSLENTRQRLAFFFESPSIELSSRKRGGARALIRFGARKAAPVAAAKG